MKSEPNRPKAIVEEIVRKMQSCGLGLKRKTAELGPYNPLWVTAFEWLSTLIALSKTGMPRYEYTLAKDKFIKRVFKNKIAE